MGNFILDFVKRNFWATLFTLLSLFFFVLLTTVFQPVSSHSYDMEPVTLKIPKGSTFQQIADSLRHKGVIRHKKLFQLLGVLSGKDQRIHSGLYQIPPHYSPWQVLNYLSSGNNVAIRVTIPEGAPASQVAQILQSTIQIDSARFMNLVNDSSFAESLGTAASSLEGYLLPETYFFDWKMPEEELIRFLVKRTLAMFEPDSIRRRLVELDMDINKVLTMASIIEGEVQVDSERVLVSSVYHNRLKRGWRLQADPTIQYLLPGKPRRLTLRDLEIDSPYNTYKYPGLPPAPINNPGRKSILAAMYPADTDYLYFVASGDGGHRFSRTLNEHNYWKRQFDKVRRRVRLEEKLKNSDGPEQRPQ